ncbi:MAG: 3-methyl-2-oxobutanoate hydroxymethyltransferase [Betaproteobacteria bacterium RIFCSPLOWO2_12_FULL_62_13b]|nr:MAG: 3-methyl-2-oxobutanoate hydroxymethyltransferase [Betaproteobacteria bacterium RIFCSPLOWO2_12_FULL_62_13b]
MNDKRITLTDLHKLRRDGSKIAMLTGYDASFAALLENAGVDGILVGDSLGNVLQGHDTTLPVTLADMVYHVGCVARGAKRAFLIGDMSFGSYQENAEQAFRNAALLMAAGAHMVKIEGGATFAPTTEFLVKRGIPVCAHLGLTPQSVHQLGGFRVQGKTADAAKQLIEDALALERSGASLIVLEAIPAKLAAEVTDSLSIPTIGIGAGRDCSGQVLVLHDLLGVFPGKKAKFVRNFMDGAASIQQAVENYVRAVKDGSFPGPEHSF